VAVPALLAVALSLGFFWAFGNVGLDLTDEGFLWYGVQRTAAGEVPLRDFQAYDPGRYYWCAAWSRLFGDGLLALRLSITLFKALGLFFGLLVARRAVERPWGLVPIGFVLALWMFPRHKGFEPAIAMVAVWAATRLLERPDARRFLLAGAVAGLAAFFGRNHAAYAGVGGLLLLGLLVLRRPDVRLARSALAWGSGVGLGLLPTLAMLAFVPGFAASSWEFTQQILAHGSNLPAPVPWPWRVDYTHLDWIHRAGAFGGGLSYLLLVLAYPVCLAAVWRTPPERLPERAAFAASAVLGILWAHHAAVRSDLAHLAQCIHPLWLALFCAPRAFGFRQRLAPALAIWALPVALTLLVVPTADERLKATLTGAARRWTTFSVGGDAIRAPAPRALYFGRIQQAVARRVAPDDVLFIAPYYPGLYPLLGKRSPVWEIYFLWPADAERQQAIIASLESEGVRWALLFGGALEDRPELHFANSHQQVWRYLQSRFEPVRDSRPRPGYRLLRRRPTGPAAGDPLEPHRLR
jgi:hypothetical protein